MLSSDLTGGFSSNISKILAKFSLFNLLKILNIKKNNIIVNIKFIFANVIINK